MATLKNSTINDGIVELPDHGSAPSPTAGALYANTTSLYWEDNDLVAGGGGGAADKQTTGNTLSNSAATDSGPSQGYRLAPNASTTLGVIAKANTFMQGTFYNEVILLGDVVAPGLYIRGEGTDDSTSITEQGPTGHTLTVTGAKYENTKSLPWSTTSILFDGSDDVITAASHPDFTLGTGDFTVEAWVYPDDRSGDMGIFGTCNTGVGRKGIRLYHKNSTGLLQLYASTTDSSNDIVDGLTSSVALTEAGWNHVAVTRVGNVFTIYVNGKVAAQTTGGGSIPENGALHIGKPGSVGSDVFDGYMAEFRWTKGMTRYSGNFAPPRGFLSSRMASFAIDAATFHSTDSPNTKDIGARDRLGEDSLGSGHCQVTFKDNYTINSTAYMIPIEIRNSAGHEFSLNYNIWPRSFANTYMLESDSLPVFKASAFYGNRGVFAGGRGPTVSDTIDFFTIGTVSETATDFHELTAAMQYLGGASNGARGVFTGGETTTQVDTINFITFATTGAATDFGETTDARQIAGSASDGSRGVSYGGYDGSSYVKVIDYVTISTASNSRSFGTLTKHQAYAGITSNGSRAVIVSGFVGPPNDSSIYYNTISTLGDSVEFGVVTEGRRLGQSVSDGQRAVHGGGRPAPGTAESDIMDYFNIGVLGNAVDWGADLTDARSQLTAVGNGSRGLFAGGDAPGAVDTVDYITIGVHGVSATDFGELSQARNNTPGAASGD